MPKRDIKLSLDFSRKDNFPKFEVKQFDSLTLNITPLENGVAYSTANCTAKLYVGCYGEVFEQDTDIIVNDNNIIINVDRNLLSKQSIAYAEIELTDNLGIVTSATFTFNIVSKIGEGSTIPGHIDGFVTKYEKLISEFKNQVNNAILDSENRTTETLNTFNSNANNKLQDLEARFQTLTTSQQQDSEVIDARKGETSLKAKIDKIDEQFNTKASKNEVDIERKRIDSFTSLAEGSTTGDAELIDGRIGADGIIYDNLGNAVRNQMSSVLSGNIIDKSIIANKTDFAVDYTNLLSNVDFVFNKALNTDNGNEFDFTDYYLSDFITIVGNSDCTISNLGQICFYDKAGKFISALKPELTNTKTTFKTPSQCRKIRISLHSSSFNNNKYLVYGSNVDDSKLNKLFIPKLIISKNTQIDDNIIENRMFKYKTIDADKLSFIETTIDYLRNKTLIDKKALASHNGSLFDYATFSTTEYIEIESDCLYDINNLGQICFYDSNKVFIKAFESEMTYKQATFTAPSNAKYIRVSNKTVNWDAGIVKLIKNGENFNDIDKIKIQNLVVDNNTIGSIISKLITSNEKLNIKLLGDSITHGVGSTDFSATGETIMSSWSTWKRNTGLQCWASKFKSYMEEKFNCEVINNGCTGISTSDIVSNWSTLVSNEDDIIICTIGTNDRNNGDKSLFYNRIINIYNLAVSLNKPIIFIANIPASVNNEKQYTMHMEDVNNIISCVCGNYNIPFISLYNQFIDYCNYKNITIDSLLSDGLHPNDVGYDVMFKLILKSLGLAIKRDGATW